MKKKVFALLVSLLAVGSMAFAQGSQEAASKKEDNSPITIEFWTHEDANRQALEDRYIKEFQETHPNVTARRS